VEGRINKNGGFLFTHTKTNTKTNTQTIATHYNAAIRCHAYEEFAEICQVFAPAALICSLYKVFSSHIFSLETHMRFAREQDDTQYIKNPLIILTINAFPMEHFNNSNKFISCERVWVIIDSQLDSFSQLFLNNSKNKS